MKGSALWWEDFEVSRDLEELDACRRADSSLGVRR